MIWRLAWRNLWRNTRRTVLTMTIIAMGLSLLILLASYLVGMSGKLQTQLARSSIGHLQVHHPQFRSQRQVDMLIPDASKVVDAMENLPEVEAVRPRITLTASIRSSMSSTVRIVPLLGVDRNREIGASRTPDQVIDGQYVVRPPEALEPDAPMRHRMRRGITLGDKLARLLNVGLGSRVRMDMAGLTEATVSGAWYVTGIVDTGADSVDQSIAIVDIAGLQQLLGAGDQVHEISALLYDGAQTDAVVDTIAGKLASVEVELRQLELSWADQMSSDDLQSPTHGVLAVESWAAIAPDVKAMLGMMDMASGFTYALMLILMSSGILTTMFTVVFERRRELGVQSALGSSPWRIFAGSMTEAVWLAALSVGLGLAVGGVWAWLLTTYGIDLSGMSGNLSAGGLTIDSVLKGEMTVGVFVEPAMVVFVATMLFALLPSIRMARMKPVEAMADKG